jgi:MSHA biogenesis protein MshP
MYSNARQQGFSLPIAVFILVIMALIGVALIDITKIGYQGMSTEVMSTRAFYASESGAQYALSQLFPLDGSPASCLAPYPTLNFNSNGLNNCSAVVSCNSNTVGSNTYYIISSIGNCNTGEFSATRQIEVMAMSL